MPSRSDVPRDSPPRTPVPDLSLQVVTDWIHAYYTRRDADLIDLAHPQIELHPRPGGPTEVYRGRPGIWQWLADTAATRLTVDEFSLARLEDGRILASSHAQGLDVTATFTVAGTLVTHLALYVADVAELQRTGVIGAAPVEQISSRVPLVRLLADAAARASQRR